MRALLVANKQLSRALKRGLEQAGFTVDLAVSGTEANDKVTATSYDMILYDMALPQADAAPSLLRRWRNGGKDPGLFLMDASDVVQGADAASSKDEILRVHDLEIDFQAMTIKRAGQAIHLTPREFAILKYLVLHRGKVVTRSMLREHFYHADEGSSNVIDVYIRYLRSKIDDGFEKPLIMTRWGQGYMMRSEDDA